MAYGDESEGQKRLSKMYGRERDDRDARLNDFKRV